MSKYFLNKRKLKKQSLKTYLRTKPVMLLLK